MYLDNFINERTYHCWQPGESVFLDAPTGSGKTTFVLERLVPYALRSNQEVLFLSNRYLLREQVKAKVAKTQRLPAEDLDWLEQVEEFEGITILSYQKLQILVEKGMEEKYYRSERYRYVVFDEAHYILEDSLFNPKIKFLLNYIERMFSTKVFMSATISEVKTFLLRNGLLGKIMQGSETKVDDFLKWAVLDTVMGRTMNLFWKRIWFYYVPAEKKEIHVKYFENYEEITEVMNRSSEKWLIFLSNKTGMKNWERQLRIPCDVIHAGERKEEVVEEIIQHEKFTKQALITTKLLDNGVNFKDTQLKNVVIDAISETEFIQMLGRKRFMQGDEYLTLYIPKKSVRYFSGYLQMNIKKSLEILEGGVTGDRMMSRMLEEPEVYEIIRRFCIFRGGKLQVNEAGIFKLRQIAKFLRHMQEAMKEDGWAFIKEQLSWIGLENTFSEENSLSSGKKQEKLQCCRDFLNEAAGQWMRKSKQKEFRKGIGQHMEELGFIKKKGGRIPGKQVIERFLENQCPEFILDVKKSSHRGEETWWKIARRG